VDWRRLLMMMMMMMMMMMIYLYLQLLSIKANEVYVIQNVKERVWKECEGPEYFSAFFLLLL
jgi:hypothetical protein